MTEHERDVLTFMISNGEPWLGDEPVTEADRGRWLERLADVRVGARCTCRTCPSIELEDAEGFVAMSEDNRVILDAPSYSAAIVLLFIDDDRPSYLELAPNDGDRVFNEFPSVAELSG